MYRLPSERVTLDLDGCTVEVERLSSWSVHFECQQLAAAFIAAEGAAAEYRALIPLFERFLLEAQPTWEIADHRGPIPVSAAGLMRLYPRSAQMFSQWLELYVIAQEEPEERPEIPGLSLVESDAPSAVDAVVPPGPLNREIKRRLREAKKAA